MNNKPYPLYDVMEVKNLKELVNKCADTFGKKVAFKFEREKEEVCISYSQFKSDVDALGTALYDMGIQNTKIAVIGENSYEWILSYLSIVNSGNVLVPIDKELMPPDINTLINHAGVQVFIYSDTYEDVIDFLRENNTEIRHYINMNTLISLVEKGNSLIQNGNNSIVKYSIDNNKLALLIYTSGTTGSAKAVMLSHNNVACNAVGTCKIVSFPESFLLILPMHHIFALDVGIAVMMLHGASIAINSSLKNIAGDLQKYKPRNIFMVPLFAESFYKQIMAVAGENAKQETLIQIADKVFGGNLKTIGCGSAPIDIKYINWYRELGIEFLEGYGLTECAGVGSVNRNNYYRDNSIGQILPNSEVKIIDSDENGNGEICIKGDHIMLGYYKNDEATTEAIDGEWLKTGDIGYIDEDGFLFISGRKKNLIILSNGKNVYPEEIEFELQGIPFIKEVVVKEDTAMHGDTDLLIAEIFPDYDNAKTQSVNDIQAHFDQAIEEYNKKAPSFKHIRRVILRDIEFPKTTTKKIKRNAEV